MKLKPLAVLVALAAWTTLATAACAQITPQPTATAQPTLTPLPTDTPQPTNTPAPTSTPLPPTYAEPAPTFPAALTVNGVHAVQALTSNGFTYAGGQPVGACASSCAVYDNAKLGAKVTVYADGTLSSTTTIGADVSSQVDAMYAVVDKIYGSSVTDWIVNHSIALLQG